MNVDGSHFQLLHTFSITDNAGTGVSSLTLDGSTLYGTTTGEFGQAPTVFEVNVDGSGFQTLQDLAPPGGVDEISSSVVVVGSQLVGFVNSVGPDPGGFAYSLNKDGSDFQILHTFPASSPPNLFGTEFVFGPAVSGNTVYGMRSEYKGLNELFAITVPEPGSLALAALAALCVVPAGVRRRRRR